MFVYNRSIVAVLAPLALLLAVALWSNADDVPKHGTEQVAAADRGVVGSEADRPTLTASNGRSTTR